MGWFDAAAAAAQGGAMACAMVLFAWTLYINRQRDKRTDEVTDRLLTVIEKDAVAKERLTAAVDALSDTIEHKLHGGGTSR